MESGYLTLSMNKDLKITIKGHLPPGNSNVLSVRVVKEWRLLGQEAVTLMNEDFCPVLRDSSRLPI